MYVYRGLARSGSTWFDLSRSTKANDVFKTECEGECNADPHGPGAATDADLVSGTVDFVDRVGGKEEGDSLLLPDICSAIGVVHQKDVVLGSH